MWVGKYPALNDKMSERTPLNAEEVLGSFPVLFLGGGCCGDGLVPRYVGR